MPWEPTQGEYDEHETRGGVTARGGIVRKRHHAVIDGHSLLTPGCRVVLAELSPDSTSKERRDWLKWVRTRCGVDVSRAESFRPSQPGVPEVTLVYELVGPEAATALACQPDIVRDAYPRIGGVRIPRGMGTVGPARRPAPSSGKPPKYQSPSFPDRHPCHDAETRVCR